MAAIRVLYVDDEPGLLELGKLFLEKGGRFAVDTLTSAQAALDLLNLTKYDAIIADYKMPDMDGIEFLKKVRASGNHIPFILFTGRGREEVVIQALNEGADFYLQKGGDPTPQFTELSHKIHQAVHKRKAEIERKQTEVEVKQKNLILVTIHEMEREFAELPSGKRVENLAAKKLSALSGAVVTVFSTYYPADQMLRTTCIEFAPGILESLPGSWENVSRWMGMQPDKVEIPVSKEMYQDINRSIVGTKKTITEISYGKITQRVSASIQKLSGIDRFIHIAHIIDGELYGTSVIGLRPDQPDPSGELLDSFAHMVAVSLRRQRAETALRESEGKFKAVMDQSIDGIIIVDFTGKLLFANNSVAQFTGYDPGMVGELNVLEIVSPEFRLQAMSDFALVAAGTDSYPMEYKIIGAQKKELWIECIAKKISFAGSSAVILSIRDLSGRQRAEGALRTREEVFRQLTENLSGVFYIHDRASNNFIFVSPAYEKVWMRSRQSLYDNPYSYLEAVHPDDLPRLQESIRRELEGGVYVDTEYRIIRPDGTERWIHSRNFPVIGERGSVYRIAGVAEDVTDLKKSLSALEESEEKYRLIADNTADNIWIFDMDFRLQYISPSVEKMRGFSVEEAMAMPLDRHMTPESLLNVLSLFQKEMEREAAGTADPRRRVSFETEEYCKDGSTIQVENSVTLLRDATGRPLSILGVSRDITERKKTEQSLRLVNRKLNLLSGITRHDISNQLLTLNGFVALLHDKNPDPVFENIFSRIEEASSQINAMIRFTREYEQIGVGSPVWQDLRSVMNNAKKDESPGQVLYKNNLPAGTEVFADSLIVRVFSNLLDNAIRHGQRVSEVRVSSHRSGKDLVVVWEDNGVGIPAGEKERIFELGMGNHTGLGLFLAREILSLTDITITETGEPGKGARFEIVVPEGAYRVSGG